MQYSNWCIQLWHINSGTSMQEKIRLENVLNRRMNTANVRRCITVPVTYRTPHTGPTCASQLRPQRPVTAVTVRQYRARCTAVLGLITKREVMGHSENGSRLSIFLPVSKEQVLSIIFECSLYSA